MHLQKIRNILKIVFSKLNIIIYSIRINIHFFSLEDKAINITFLDTILDKHFFIAYNLL